MYPAFSFFLDDLASSMDLRRSWAGGGVPIESLPALAADIVNRRLASTGGEANATTLGDEHKKRYIVAPLLYQQSAGPTTKDSLRTIHRTLREAIVRSEHEGGPKVLKLSTLEASVIKERFTGLLVEEDVQYKLPRTPLLGEIDHVNVPQSVSKKLDVQVRGNGKPVAEARVVLFTKLAARQGYEGTTNVEGNLKLAVRKAHAKFEKIIVLPKSGYWSRVWHDIGNTSPLTLELSPLSVEGFDWGHQATEAVDRGKYLGQGVKIAVIDTGIARHPSLNIAAGKNFIVGEAADAWDNDIEGHGTHCAGVIAAAERAASMWGYVPQSSMYGLRVFGGSDGGGYSSDIADAIDWAIKKECDIISMSIASSIASGYLKQKIEKATDAGVFCIAAAGNDGGIVSYPAKFKNVVAISALGRIGAYPKDSIHVDAESEIRSSDRQFYLASFSNRGEEVVFCAPGVAITSTLPTDAFGAWDGTSMACPHVTGVAAITLQASPRIFASNRDAERTAMLLDRLQGICRDLGMGRIYQGIGLPLVSQLAKRRRSSSQ